MVTRDDTSLDSGVHVGDAVVLSLVTPCGGVQNLRATGYETLGPTVRHVVALHWHWVCDRLSPSDFAALRACTHLNLDAVDVLAAPGPTVIGNT